MKGLLLDFGGTLDSDGVHWSTLLARAFAEAGMSAPRERLDQAFLASERVINADPSLVHLGLAAHVRLQVGLMFGHLNKDSVTGVENSPPPVQQSTTDGNSPGHDTERPEQKSLADGIARIMVHRLVDKIALSRALLERHAQHLKLAIISNFTPNLPLILRETGLEPLMERVYCSALVGLSKPDPALFRLALAELGIQPEEAMMVGDSLPSDIMPAKALGLTTCWIRGDRVFGRGDPAAADHVVANLAEALVICAQDHCAVVQGGPK